MSHGQTDANRTAQLHVTHLLHGSPSAGIGLHCHAGWPMMHRIRWVHKNECEERLESSLALYRECMRPERKPAHCVRCCTMPAWALVATGIEPQRWSAHVRSRIAARTRAFLPRIVSILVTWPKWSPKTSCERHVRAEVSSYARTTPPLRQRHAMNVIFLNFIVAPDPLLCDLLM